MQMRWMVASVLGVVMTTGTGCGLTCELQGVPYDYADCDTATAALSESNLTGGQKSDLEECIVESCGGGEETAE